MYCFSWINVVLEQLATSWFLTETNNKVQSLPDDVNVEILDKLPAKKALDTNYKVQSLPNDIIYEILGKLPTKEVLDYRRVCKNWNTLTSTSKFTSKHLVNSSPSILIVYMKKCNNILERHAVLYDEWEGATKVSKNAIKRLGPNSICPVPLLHDDFDFNSYFEYPGIFIFTPKRPLFVPYNPTSQIRSHILYNPVTRQKLVLNTYLGYICACFYNSSKDEYQVLWIRRTSDFIRYRILDLGSPMEERSWRPLNSFDHVPRCGKSVRSFYMNKEYLFWMNSKAHNKSQPWCSDSIVMFDIGKEEFSTMPHPGHKCTATTSRHMCMHLLELKHGSKVEPFLCLCDCTIQDQIDMWVLEDCVNQVWVIRHKIVLDFTIYCSPLDCHGTEVLMPFGLINGELLINMDDLGIFAYNLNKGTLRRIIEVCDWNVDHNIYRYKINVVSLFYNNLASFSNFKGLYANMKY